MTVAEHLAFGVGVLTEAIARELDRSTGVRVPREAWNPAALPDHLRMNVHVIGEDGKIIATGRDLNALRARLGSAASDGLTMPVDERFDRQGLTHWDFDDLPERIALTRGGVQVFAFPAVIDEGQGVGVKVFDTREAALAAHRAGLRRLYVLAVREELAMHVEYLPGLEQMTLHYAALKFTTENTENTQDKHGLESDLVDLIADRVFLRDDADVRTEAEFKRRLDAGWDQLWTVSSTVADLVARILSAHHDVELRLEGAADNPFLQPAVEDIRAQLRGLMPPRFLVSTPWRWLGEFPRFLNAIIIRLQKLTNAGLKRDHQATQAVNDFWRRYAERNARNESIGRVEPAAGGLAEFRWLIEELRVSLFAQELRTSVAVSPHRLERAWAQIA
jgi:ATP-dependent helicase HrpA